METIFIDSVYWIAIANPKDQWHQEADRVRTEHLGHGEGVQRVTSEEVLTEVLTAFSSQGQYFRGLVVKTVDEIINDLNIEVVAQSRKSFSLGLKLYRERIDKGYSLQDCISMNIMKERNITKILTNDQHFEQEGFITLMKK